jgi:hypothetical protein
VLGLARLARAIYGDKPRGAIRALKLTGWVGLFDSVGSAPWGAIGPRQGSWLARIRRTCFFRSPYFGSVILARNYYTADQKSFGTQHDAPLEAAKNHQPERADPAKDHGSRISHSME